MVGLEFRICRERSQHKSALSSLCQTITLHNRTLYEPLVYPLYIAFNFAIASFITSKNLTNHIIQCAVIHSFDDFFLCYIPFTFILIFFFCFFQFFVFQLIVVHFYNNNRLIIYICLIIFSLLYTDEKFS